MAGEYATKAELAGALAQTEKRIAGQVTEKIRDAQTEVLRAFYNRARPAETKWRHVDELAQRLSWVEERVTALEKDRLIGGQQ